MRVLASLSMLAVLAAPVVARANSYNPINYVSATGSNSPFSYGFGTGGSSFTAYPSSFSNFQGTPGVYFATGQDGLPTVGYSSKGVVFGTVNVPNTELWLHPGNAPTGIDTIVEFTTPTAGFYSGNVSFTRRDTKATTTAGTTGGDGTFVSIYVGNTLVGFKTLTGAPGVSYHFDGGEMLAAGTVVSFVVNDNGGSYYNDSTGLAVNIVNTPEPSSLALLGTGVLGLAGAARRKFRRS